MRETVDDKKERVSHGSSLFNDALLRSILTYALFSEGEVEESYEGEVEENCRKVWKEAAPQTHEHRMIFVTCEYCGKDWDIHDDSQKFITIYGDVTIGLDGGVIGGNFKNGKLYRSSVYCRPGVEDCLISTLKSELRFQPRNKKFLSNIS